MDKTNKELLRQAAINIEQMNAEKINPDELKKILSIIQNLTGNSLQESEEEHKETQVNHTSSKPPAESRKKKKQPELKQDDIQKTESKKTEAVVFEHTTLPSFALMTSAGLMNCINAVIKQFDKETNSYLLEVGENKLRLPKSTLESIIKPSSEQDLKTQLIADDIIQADEKSSVVFGKTLLPEFSMITQEGMKTYKDMVVEKYDPVLEQYILSNNNTAVSVSKTTFQEITDPSRSDKTFTKKTPEYEKLLETQYKDYFSQRENTAGNFRHNFAVYCRKESNSPVDAIQISRELYSRMNYEEQKKTRNLMQQLKKDDESMTECLMRFYFEAVKDVPLNENYIRENRPESVIARPFYDTITADGSLIDNSLNIRIGDIVENLNFTVHNPFSKGKEKINEPLSIVSSSKEGNMIVMMNKDKSYYQIPRDEFLTQYRTSITHQKKAEMKVQRRTSIEIER